MIQNHLNSSTSATNVAPRPFSISFCNMRGLSSNINPVHHHLQSINHMYSSSLKPKSSLSIPVTAPFSLLISNAHVISYFSLSSLMVGFVHLFALMCRPYTSNNSIFLILAFNSSDRKFPFLVPQSTFALYTALLTQTIMNFFSTTFPNQSKPSLYNLHALKSLFLVISTSTTPTGPPIPPMSPTLLVGKLRPLPLSMTWCRYFQSRHAFLIVQETKQILSILSSHLILGFNLLPLLALLLVTLIIVS